MSHISSKVHFFVSKKGSGKSYKVGNMLHDLCQNGDITHFYGFCSTHDLDPSWKRIKKILKKHKVHTEFYDELTDRKLDERGREMKVNNLQSVLDDIQKNIIGKPPPTEGDNENVIASEYSYDTIRKVWLWKGTFVIASPPQEVLEKVNKKAKGHIKPVKFSPCFVIDDCSKKNLRSVPLYNFLKRSRHFSSGGGVCNVFLSSQFITDLQPESWANVDKVHVFRSFPEPYLKRLHSNCQLSMPFDTFVDTYKERTKEPFTSIEVDLRNDAIE